MIVKIHILWLILIASCLIGFLSEPAGAQGRLRLHGGGGVTKALSPTNFSNRYRLGLNAGAAVGYELEKYGLEPVVSGMYSQYRIDPTAIGGNNAEIDGGERSIWSASVGTYFHMNSGTTSYRGRRHLYLIGQIGLRGLRINGATLRSTAGESTWEKRTETRFGTVFGLGMEFPLVERLSFKLEPTFDIMFTEGERTTAILLRSGLVFSRR